jgi:demethylmenaquinone methyltransferase/2-methoxy-6-polyprenyl-1,4-benzoquinol methylase
VTVEARQSKAFGLRGVNAGAILETMSDRLRRDRSPDDDSHIADVVAAQKEYYELRAPDYATPTKPSDRAGRNVFPEELAEQVLDDLRPAGDVLELACGPGPLFTSELARRAESVTAVDASQAMLRLNRARVADPKVTYVEADLFRWTPERTYDFVFFGHWLSHVPAARFDLFWALVRTCLGDNGRVGFIDEDDRAEWMDPDRPSHDAEVARRTLSDGRHYDIVKVFWSPEVLQCRLQALHWDVRIKRLGASSLIGLGKPT